MPKSKAIEVRPRKRKLSQKTEESTNPVAEHPKREVNHLPHLSESSRHSKFKGRGNSERPSLIDFHIGNKIPKRLVLPAVYMGILLMLVVIAFHQMTIWYQGKLVVTPINLPKVISDASLSERSHSLFWGSYRPGIYFGMKHRSPKSLLFGVMWTTQYSNFKFRYACDQYDGILSYNWLEHDGRTFGTQQIVDIHHIITISFVKPSNDFMASDWTVRISAVSRNYTSVRYPLSVVVYFYYPGDETDFFIHPIISDQKLTGLQGSSMELSDFHVMFHPSPDRLQLSSLKAHIPREDAIKEAMFTGLGVRRDNNLLALTGVPQNFNKEQPPNAWFYEVSANVPEFSDVTEPNKPILEVEFLRPQNSFRGFYGSSFSEELSRKSRNFHERFAEKFNVDLTKFSDRQALLDRLPRLSISEANEFRRWSMLILPRLHVWYQWFNKTQIGTVPLSYRWRGRNPNEVHQLNPLTLSSGLDDFPRASHPTDDERHIDLRCWMTLFARVMARLASVVTHFMQTDQNGSSRSKLDETRSLIADYTQWADLLSEQSELDRLHWSEKLGRYADYGLHTDFVKLELPVLPSEVQHTTNKQAKRIRVVVKPPSLQLVSTSFGYVNLFPLLLRVLPPASPRLPRLLADLSNKELLWSEFGLRSINLKSPFYHTHNTEDDPPYWRGAIWINMNYLAVQALRYYSHNPHTPKSVALEAERLTGELTQNLARTVLGELERTGYLWEQYNDQTGHGQRGHPFSGWTSLISLIISDNS
ncbi:unnamed protein product [Heterobilharzia americana]|nr:unnamed protein product [Heterobilharzia americana]